MQRWIIPKKVKVMNIKRQINTDIRTHAHLSLSLSSILVCVKETQNVHVYRP